MCQIRTTNYTVCAHRRTTKQRCQNNLSKPKTKCEKLRYNDTVLDSCPKCSRTSAKQRSSPPPVLNHGLRTESVQFSGSTLVDDVDDEVTELCEPSGRKKAATGLSRMFRSLRSNRGRKNKADQGEVGSTQQVAIVRSVEGEESVRSSEQLAKEYRSILGRHPNTVLFVYRGIRDVPAPNKVVDIETCTTWSTFLPRLDPLTGKRAEKPVEAAASGVWNTPEERRSGKDEELRVAGGSAESRGTKEVRSVDSVRRDEFRRAEERRVRVKDGRGLVHFPR